LKNSMTVGGKGGVEGPKDNINVDSDVVSRIKGGRTRGEPQAVCAGGSVARAVWCGGGSR